MRTVATIGFDPSASTWSARPYPKSHPNGSVWVAFIDSDANIVRVDDPTTKFIPGAVEGAARAGEIFDWPVAVRVPRNLAAHVGTIDDIVANSRRIHVALAAGNDDIAAAVLKALSGTDLVTQGRHIVSIARCLHNLDSRPARLHPVVELAADHWLSAWDGVEDPYNPVGAPQQVALTLAGSTHGLDTATRIAAFVEGGGQSQLDALDNEVCHRILANIVMRQHQMADARLLPEAAAIFSTSKVDLVHMATRAWDRYYPRG